MNFNFKALAVCQKPNEKPFVVSVYTYFDKDVVISTLERFKKEYENTEINILSSWVEKIETQELGDSKLYKVYIKTNYLDSNEYAMVGKYITQKNAEDIENDYKEQDWVVDTKIEILDFKEEFYKRICKSYINTMDAELIFENKENNNSILHAHIADEAIALKHEGKIDINNVKDYLLDEESIYEYETYEDFYEKYVRDGIYADIRDLGLFNGENDKWDFYLSYNDMILLGMEKSIEESIIKEIAEDFETNKEDEQDVL